MITKEPKDTAACTLPIFFTKSARSAFLHILRYIKKNNPKPILLPAYIGINDYEGSGVFDSVFISRINYEFYPLNEKLDVEFDVLKKKIQSKEYSSLLLIHYFGFPTEMFNEIVELCKSYEVILIEDCAHTLSSKFSNKELGEFGDFSFYSIHKSIATFDGGILKINNADYSDFPTICPVKEGVSLSALSQYFRTDFKLSDSKRRENYQFLLDNFPESKYITLLKPTLQEQIVPLNFPVLIHNHLREKVYFSLMEKGVLTMALYYRMIPQIDQSEFPLAYITSKSILNFPIHQNIDTEDLIKMTLTVKEVFQNLE